MVDVLIFKAIKKAFAELETQASADGATWLTNLFRNGENVGGENYIEAAKSLFRSANKDIRITYSFDQQETKKGSIHLFVESDDAMEGDALGGGRGFGGKGDSQSENSFTKQRNFGVALYIFHANATSRTILYHTLRSYLYAFFYEYKTGSIGTWKISGRDWQMDNALKPEYMFGRVIHISGIHTLNIPRLNSSNQGEAFNFEGRAV